VEVRFAKPDDREALLDLVDDFVGFFCSLRGEQHLTSPETREKQRRLFDRMLGDDNVELFIADEGGRLVGFADVLLLPILQTGAVEAKIEDLFVTDELRGKGVGGALLDAVGAFCRDRGIEVFTLTSGLDLEDAHRFYEKHGGQFTERMYRFELDGG
jgi:GNAT superfamily N-acetyltransferase